MPETFWGVARELDDAPSVVLDGAGGPGAHALEPLPQHRTGDPPVSFSEFIRWVDTGQVDRVELTGTEIIGTSSSGK